MDVFILDSKLSEDEYYIGGILLRHLQILQFNAHEIAEFVVPKDDSLKGGKSVFMGAGVFPTVALCNHSCEPSIVR